MTEEEARQILAPYLNQDGMESHHPNYIQAHGAGDQKSLTLDGDDWTPELLEALAWWLRHNQ